MVDALSVVERTHGRWLSNDDFRPSRSLKCADHARRPDVTQIHRVSFGICYGGPWAQRFAFSR